MDVGKIFSAFDKFSAAVHKADKIRELSHEVNKPRTCGDCYNWMKSSQCPMERNVNGRNVGPSCSGMICEKFIEEKSTTEYRAKKAGELAELINSK